MKLKHAALALAASVLATPAVFAQATQPAATQTVTTVVAAGPLLGVEPRVASVNSAPHRPMPDGVIAEADVTVSVDGNTTTTVRRYYWNMPDTIQREREFLRWQRLL